MQLQVGKEDNCYVTWLCIVCDWIMEVPGSSGCKILVVSRCWLVRVNLESCSDHLRRFSGFHRHLGGFTVSDYS